MPVGRVNALHVQTADGERSETHPSHPNLHAPLIDDFTQAVVDAREPRVSGAIGLDVAKAEAEIYLIASTRASGQTGRFEDHTHP
jgi:hypothetical protein